MPIGAHTRYLRGVSSRPPAEPRPGIGEWPVWGDEPPELWFAQVASRPVPATAPLPPGPRVAAAGPASPDLTLPGFVLGLIGACLCWVPLVGLGCGIFGAVLSLQARRAFPPGHRGRELPTVGLVFACIGIAVGVVASAIFTTIALDGLFNAVYGG